MLALFILAAAPAVTPAPPTPLPIQSEARSVVEWQLRAQPRSEEDMRLEAQEAESIYRRYLGSIGKMLEKPDSSGGSNAR